MADGIINQFPHPPDRFFQPPEHGITHDRVADIELFDLGDRGDRLDVLVGETVSRMNRQTDATGMCRRFTQFIQRILATRFVRRSDSTWFFRRRLFRRICIRASMNLDCGNTERSRDIDDLP